MPIGADEFIELLSLSSLDTELSTLQPEASPKLVGCVVRVDELAEKPGAGVQVPAGVVQAAKLTDFVMVDCETVNENA